MINVTVLVYAKHPHCKVSPAKPAPHAINLYREYYWAAVAESQAKGHSWDRGAVATIASNNKKQGKRIKKQGINVVDIEVAIEDQSTDKKLTMLAIRN